MSSCARCWRIGLEEAEDLAGRLRRRAGLSQETPEQIAQALGHPIIRGKSLPSADGHRASGASFEGDPAIYLDAALHKNREQFVIGHELFEHHLRRGRWTDEEHERLCQRGGAALALPDVRFLDAVRAFGFDLPALRRHFIHASYTSLARRVLDLVPGSALAKWRDGNCYFEDSHVGFEPQLATHVAHTAVAAEVLSGSGRATVEFGGVRAAAWRLPGLAAKHALSLSVQAG